METTKVLDKAIRLLDDFRKLDENSQDKIVGGVQCLAFLQTLVDIKPDDDKNLSVWEFSQ